MSFTALPDNSGLLVLKGRMALGMTQEQLAEMLRSSTRTVARWESQTAVPSGPQYHALARAVYPKNAALAEEIARGVGTDLVALGLVQGPPPPVAESLLVESVVCAAAVALQVTPDAVRPAVRAAFHRARAMRLTLEAVDDALQAGPPPVEAAPAKAKPRKG